MAPQDSRADPILLVGGDRSHERELTVRPGPTIVGRDSACDLVLRADGVSRRHARLTRLADDVSIQDLGSTNGTYVNNQRVSGVERLRRGDVVTLGHATLRYSAPSTPRSPDAPRRRARVQVWRVLLVGGLANLLLLVLGVVVQRLTDWTGVGPWLAAPLTGMAAALVELVREALIKAPEPEATSPEPGAQVPHPRAGTASVDRRSRRSGSGQPVAVAVIAALLVLGVGGGIATYAVARVSGYVTGNQAGVDRLVGGPVAVDSSGVLTTVTGVEHTADFTRVEVSVRNGLANTITLPLFGYASLSAEDGTTVEADPSRSSWVAAIAPGQLRTGTIVFGGHLPGDATTASLVFSTVFEQGFSGPSSISVDGLSLAPVEQESMAR